MENPAQKEWSRLAKRTVALINFGWWTDIFAPVIVSLGLTAATALLILRSHVEAVPTTYLIAGSVSLFLLGALISFLRARKRFAPVESGFVRLEEHLRLHNALTAARDGVRPWPRPPESRAQHNGLQYQWSRLLVPVFLVSGAIAAALLVPIKITDPADHLAPSEPLSWSKMESWLDELEEEEVAEPEALEKIREQVQQLRDHDNNEWFSHSSLEATDNLAEQLRQSINELGKDAHTAERTLSSLQNFSDELSATNRDNLINKYQEALKGLASNQLSPNFELLKHLQNIDPAQLKQLNPEELQRLSQQLKKSAGACKQCLGMGNGELPYGWETGLDLLNMGEAPPRAGGLRPGRGGITRGPGTAPITLSDTPTDLRTNNPEQVQTNDYSRASLGDTLSITDGQHEIDETITGPTTAGSIESTGSGGDRIWRDSLMPDEKEILKRFFE
ncbi:MAG: hypothetical protein AAF591_01080 [Verrucomicrobiota bacterium]